MPNTALNVLQVAVGVVKNADGLVLIALRDDALHQGGLWEFPGGKIEAGETAEQAVVRELHEELAITALSITPLITIHHCYADLAVTLRVFLIEQFIGEARGCLGQPLRWVKTSELSNYAFPAANRPIITAAQLPPHYAILDDTEPSLLLSNLEKILSKGITLIQARLKTLSIEAVNHFVARAYPLCQQHGALLLLNSAMAGTAITDGVHLTSQHLLALEKRPPNVRWLAASCHNQYELQHAQTIGVDFVVLAPVLATKTHPTTQPLGWERFAKWTEASALPVYALGGMSVADVITVRRVGGQGIAAIRAFLS